MKWTKGTPMNPGHYISRRTECPDVHWIGSVWENGNKTGERLNMQFTRLHDDEPLRWSEIGEWEYHGPILEAGKVKS